MRACVPVAGNGKELGGASGRRRRWVGGGATGWRGQWWMAIVSRGRGCGGGGARVFGTHTSVLHEKAGYLRVIMRASKPAHNGIVGWSPARKAVVQGGGWERWTVVETPWVPLVARISTAGTASQRGSGAELKIAGLRRVAFSGMGPMRALWRSTGPRQWVFLSVLSVFSLFSLCHPLFFRFSSVFHPFTRFSPLLCVYLHLSYIFSRLFSEFHLAASPFRDTSYIRAGLGRNTLSGSSRNHMQWPQPIAQIGAPHTPLSVAPLACNPCNVPWSPHRACTLVRHRAWRAYRRDGGG